MSIILNRFDKNENSSRLTDIEDGCLLRCVGGEFSSKRVREICTNTIFS